MPREKSMPLRGNACNLPVYKSAAYFFRSTEEVIQYHQNELKAGRYGRYTNPNWTEAEQCLARMDGAEEALIFASGMNAIATAVLSLVKSGDRIIFTGNCYRNTRAFFTKVLPDLGVEALPISSIDPQGFEDAFFQQYRQLRPRIVFIEMPCNPHLYLVDLEKIRDVIGDDETILIVDSTLASPLNFKPLDCGADLVIHSCTKYMSGYGDIMAGSVAGAQTLIDRIRTYRNIMGGIVDPSCAALLNRSLQGFPIRMAHYNQAGMKLANYLESSPFVRRVYYTGLESHPHARLAEKYLNGHGSVISFEVAGDLETTSRFVDTVKIPFMGSNFGSSTTMIEQCSIFTYFHYSEEEREELNIADSLVRLGLGYEDTDKIINDLEDSFIATFHA